MVFGIVGFGDVCYDWKKIKVIFEVVLKDIFDIKFCILINGFVLFDYVDELVEMNVDYVMIIINMVDLVIGVKIYFWIFY